MLRVRVLPLLSVVGILSACDSVGTTECPSCEAPPTRSCTAFEYRTSTGACMPLTACTTDQYEASRPGPNRDRTCAQLTVCTAEQYQHRAPSPTSDRLCRPLTTCRASQYERTPPGPTHDRVCRGLTECTASQYESTPPSATSDRTCSPLTRCRDGEYESEPPTPTSDRVCLPHVACAFTEYLAVPPGTSRDGVCLPLTECGPTEFESKAPTAISDRVCSPLTLCAETQYEARAPTAEADRVCAPLTACTVHQYESFPPTATSDRVCTPLTRCTANEYQSCAPTATTDRICTPLTICGPDEIELVPPTATSDRVCGPGRCEDVDDDGICDDVDDACTLAPPPSTSVPIDESCLVPDIVVDDPWNLAVEVFIEDDGGGSASAPLIANLDDDNEDGLIDDRDTPELVYVLLDDTSPSFAGSIVARRLDGTELFRISGMSGVHTPLIADIDQDGAPEIVAETLDGFIVALSGDGQTVEWTSTVLTGGIYGITPSIGDIDGDGDLEIATTVSSSPFRLIVLAGEDGGLVLDQPTPFGELNLAALADLDRDGDAEIVAGTQILDGEGNLLWSSETQGQIAFNAIVDADGDGHGDVIVVRNGLVTVVDLDDESTVTWPLTNSASPGPPCVADFDGDGEPEIAVPASFEIMVYELDGSHVWEDPMPMQDISGIAGCAAYDVDGDGRYEVLFADEVTLWIFDGLTGTVNFSDSSHTSGTLWEYPTIADFDKDGSAEVFVAANAFTLEPIPRTGIMVYGHAGNGWARAGSSWAIHDYAPGKIGPDNEVALGGPQPWEVHNVYRGRPTVETAASDLGIEAGDDCASSCVSGVGVVDVSFRVSNAGRSDVPAGAVVALFRAGEESGDPIAITSLDEPVLGGGTVSGIVSTTIAALKGATNLVLIVDPDGTVGDCDASNNRASHRFARCE